VALLIAVLALSAAADDGAGFADVCGGFADGGWL
jgi:hypothetical protein